ncbi:MarR family transcriptional regulator [Microbacterium protaetiae]|uniref:MarR family transcriptional regulator n=1 Tax=Microbacterium protaetiae TaxID=2509458 RepID=A0A4P6ED57_9MICO|nr:MarR family winged helix-turn-helix transcriptional regulator [Microbacterium protaetiae]QAY60034.1 MarR family transcriptional regulator [Microbacterium protaetiae]
MPASASTVVLTALTRLMTLWSSPRVQAQFARDAGIHVDPSDIPVIYVLGMQDGCRAAALADALRISRPTMSKQLQRLENAGLVAREPDPADGRASIVALSADGRTAYDALVARGLDAVDGALDTWPVDDREHFAELARRFVTSLGVDISHPSPKEN